MLHAFLTLGSRYRLATLLTVLGLTVLAAGGLPNLRIDTSLQSLINEKDPLRVVHEHVTDEFGSDNTTIIYVEHSELWTPERLLRLEDLHYALEDLPFVESVESIFSARSIRDRDGSLDSSTLIRNVPETVDEAAAIREDALYSPLLRDNIVSEDGDVVAFNVRVDDSENDPAFERFATDQMEALIAPLRDDFARVFQIGPTRVGAELRNSLLDDMILMLPLAVLVLITSIYFLMRSVFAMMIPLVPGFFSLMWTFGIMGYLGVPLNMLSAMLPSLVLVIGATEDTHMLAAYMEGVAKGRNEDKKRVRQIGVDFMARHIGLPILLTTLSTILGFGSNGLSDMQLIQDFAFATAFAIFANGILSLTVVPMILSTVGPTTVDTEEAHGAEDDGARDGHSAEVKGSKPVRMIVGVLDNLATHRPGLVIAVTILTVGFFVYQISNVRVSNNMISYFKESNEVVQQADLLHERLAGMEVFNVTLFTTEADAFRRPEYVAVLEQVTQAIEARGTFDNVLSLADHLSLVNQEFAGGDPAAFRVPDNRGLIEQYLLFFQRDDLVFYVSQDYKRASIIVRHSIHDSTDLKEEIEALDWEIANITDANMRHVFSSQSLLVNRAADSLVTAQIESLFLVLAVIFVMMSVLYTSFRGGLISLVPNVIPIVMMFGVMGLTGMTLDPATATVAMIAIGIAVDDTIHLLSRYTAECREKSDPLEAVRSTVRGEAIPVISTSLSLIAGFLVLLASNFAIITQFGILAAITMLFTLIADLLVTPILMRRVRLVGLYDILGLDITREMLQKSLLFEGLTPYQIRKTILLSSLLEFSKGDKLVRQGEVGDDMFLILKGKVDVVTEDGSGGQNTVGSIGEGQTFGEVAFVDQDKRSATIIASDDGMAIVFNHEKLERSLKSYPNIAATLNLNLCRILGSRLIQSNRRIALEGQS